MMLTKTSSDKRILELLSIKNDDNKIEIDAEIYIILISNIGGNYGND